MNRTIAHILKVKWNALLSVLIAFAFIFSMSPFANAQASVMQMENMTVTHMDVQDTSNLSSSMADCMQMEDRNDCCENDSDMPCSDDGNCKTVCTSFNLSPAVLNDPVYLRHVDMAGKTALYHPFNDGITTHINAPPPRA